MKPTKKQLAKLKKLQTMLAKKAKKRLRNRLVLAAKSLILFVLAGLIILTLAPKAKALTVQARAKVLTPLSLSETTALNFGEMLANTGGTINQAGATTGDVIALPSTGATAGLFSVVGHSNKDYSIAIPPSVSLSNGVQSMSATLSVPGGTSQSLDALGNDTFNVNGVLTVGNNQTVGSYVGTYSVTISY